MGMFFYENVIGLLLCKKKEILINSSDRWEEQIVIVSKLLVFLSVFLEENGLLLRRAARSRYPLL